MCLCLKRRHKRSWSHIAFAFFSAAYSCLAMQPQVWFFLKRLARNPCINLERSEPVSSLGRTSLEHLFLGNPKNLWVPDGSWVRRCTLRPLLEPGMQRRQLFVSWLLGHSGVLIFFTFREGPRSVSKKFQVLP